MKKLLLVGMLVMSALSFGRDYTHNDVRDIEKPAMEEQEKVSEYTSSDWAVEHQQEEKNLNKYSEFQEELDHEDRGHENR